MLLLYDSHQTSVLRTDSSKIPNVKFHVNRSSGSRDFPRRRKDAQTKTDTFTASFRSLVIKGNILFPKDGNPKSYLSRLCLDNAKDMA
jgi:hypothetical protein